MRKTRVRRHSSAPSGSPRSVRFRNVLLSLCAGLALLVAGNAEATFTDVTSAARIDAFAIHDQETVGIFAGGAGAGDYDRDGYIDLYVTRGSVGFPCLYRNRGDGTFSDQTFNAGLSSVSGLISSGTFADVDGDGWLDLLLLGLLETTPRLYLNRGDGTFALATGTGLALPGNSYSAAFGDYDRDGDLDLFVTRWGSTLSDPAATGRLWRNDGGGKFTDVSQAAGIPVFRSPLESSDVDYSFTGNFADIDDDGWPDLLVAADFGASKILRNQQDGTFDLVEQNGVPDDENGMGAAVGDFDGDGDLDWFVSSVWDPNGTSEGYWGVTGNRLYRNDGTGHFSDVSEAAGVRHGYWGWGSTFADVDLDGDPDLVEVNGYGHFPQSAEFHSDPARLFLSNGNGSFTESASALGTTIATATSTCSSPTTTAHRNSCATTPGDRASPSSSAARERTPRRSAPGSLRAPDPRTRCARSERVATSSRRIPPRRSSDWVRRAASTRSTSAGRAVPRRRCATSARAASC